MITICLILILAAIIAVALMVVTACWWLILPLGLDILLFWLIFHKKKK